MANLLTLSRILLLPVAAWLFYLEDPIWHVANACLIALIFLSDGLDGYVARKRNQTSLFGALFDIAGDRAVELVLWVVAADNGLVPIWVTIVFVIRGVVVDTLRSSGSAAQGETPFALMRTRAGKALVAGRGIRGFYAVIKAVAFCGLALLPAWPALLPGQEALIAVLAWLTYAAVYIAVTLCVLRGAPVIAEFAVAQFRAGKKQ
ncbi:MAG: CDP-alcohol phosphatidyltransferase family protein [Candidatus Peribacteraceae bacterium]|nr:CDP-alcohol phosphatidyltransferase family protein [Candidatus Peribacteraceae bacterium]